ncbi:FAD-binding oxidoreductase [Pseudomonas aeruginosa]|nr:FAD-binding oxidoreductase [Pseudomonas aeruginosa]
MDDSELYRSLCEILGARGVRDSAALAGQDPGYHPQNLAGSFLVLPESTDQVAAVVRLCRQAGRALVPQGGLTGLLAADAGLDPGIDLAARGSASIGGLVATNAGGIRAFRFGTMRQRVLGLEAVLADGSVYSDLRGLLKNTTGYDLKQLFVGAEGTLGIVTRAVLRLEPLQRPGATALLGLPDVDAAITIAARLRREHAERLFACEILWHDYLQCTAAPMGDSAPSLAPCPLYLLVELAEDRHLDAGEALTALLEDCFEDGLVEDALLAANETQRLAIWRLREDSDAAIHAGVDSLSFDVSLPVPALAGYVKRIRRRLDDLVKGMQVFLFGHFLDGNLHVMLAADVPLLPLHQAVEEILYGELGECAGVISAEHGIGLEKKEALGRYADPLKLALMAQIKELLDPNGLFNPGKVIP